MPKAVRLAARPPRTTRPRLRSRADPSRNPAGLIYTLYSGVVNNTGTASTAPIIEVAGLSPAGFFLRNATTGKTLYVAYTVPAAQTLIIDFGARTTKIAGVAVAAIVGAQQWWDLQPGNNTVESSAPSTTVKFNPAYI